MDFKANYSEKTLKMKSSMIRALVASTKNIPGLISLAGGFPSPKTFNKKLIADMYRKTVLEDGEDVLQYGASQGDTQLKQALKTLVNTELTDDELLITVGSTNAIFLYTSVFIDEGDVILAEAPSFLGSLISFETMGAKIVGLDMDDKGITPEELKKAIKEHRDRIKFLYVIPEFQNPTGKTMDLSRRQEIFEICKENNIQILEDSPYAELRYTGEHIKSIFEISREAGSDIVTLVKSFSKILGPGLRMAYAAGSQEVIEKMSSWMEKVNVSVDCVSQRCVTNFINEKLLPGHIETICEYYKPLRERMLSSLDKYMPEGIKWTNPEGGMFVWVTLPENICCDELFEKARDEKVSFIPGSKFYPTGFEKQNEIRLNFSYPTADQIEEGVKRLSVIIKKLMD